MKTQTSFSERLVELVNYATPEDLADLDAQILLAEKELRFLQTIRERMQSAAEEREAEPSPAAVESAEPVAKVKPKPLSKPTPTAAPPHPRISPAVLNGSSGKQAPKLPTAEPDDEEGPDEVDGKNSDFSREGHSGCSTIVDHRKSIAKALLKGPQKSADLREELKIDSKTFYDAIACNWFVKHSWGQYRITTLGRAAATGKQTAS